MRLQSPEPGSRYPIPPSFSLSQNPLLFNLRSWFAPWPPSPFPSFTMALRSFSAPSAAGPAARPFRPKTTASLALLSTRTANTFSWRSTANYVRLQEGPNRLLSRLTENKYIVTNRTGTFRCATMEEIEAEKSLIEKDARGRMDKTIDTLRSNFNSIRTGRANPAMLDGIQVEYYGTPVTLKSIAQISTPDSSSLLVQPYDKSSLKAIEKAIVGSNLGLTPNNDGETIRLGIPQLTSDRRKELSKLVSKQAEEGKVAIRNIRRDEIKAYEKLEKEKKLSEDNVKDLSSDLQKVTDEYIKKIDSLLKQKEKELLTV